MAHGNRYCGSPSIILPIPFLKVQLGYRKKVRKAEKKTAAERLGIRMMGSSRSPMRCKEGVLPGLL